MDLFEDARQHGGTLSDRARWSAARSLGVNPATIEREFRRYRETLIARLFGQCAAIEQELLAFLVSAASLGDDLVTAHERLLRANSRSFWALIQLGLPFPVLASFVRSNLDIPELALLHRRALRRRPLRFVDARVTNVAPEALLFGLADPQRCAAWLKRVDSSPERARPGWGAPIHVFVAAQLATAAARFPYATECSVPTASLSGAGGSGTWVRLAVERIGGVTQLELVVEASDEDRKVDRAALEWWWSMAFDLLLDAVRDPDRPKDR